ncbi:MAG: transposase, partial [Candidatus Thermoplasmatota archaeon]|nr:transposase [Candidatus Thermoplasmatota archaeon]
IVLTGYSSSKGCPDRLRRTRYFDAETEKLLTFLSNNFFIPALTIAQLYKCRWQVELFFRWIKQHLRIKAFYGTSKNAVKTQIWIAISMYVLVAIIKKRLNLDISLYTILQILSVTAFEQVPIVQVLTNFGYRKPEGDSAKQLLLIDL